MSNTHKIRGPNSARSPGKKNALTPRSKSARGVGPLLPAMKPIPIPQFQYRHVTTQPAYQTDVGPGGAAGAHLTEEAKKGRLDTVDRYKKRRFHLQVRNPPSKVYSWAVKSKADGDHLRTVFYRPQPKVHMKATMLPPKDQKVRVILPGRRTLIQRQIDKSEGMDRSNWQAVKDSNGNTYYHNLKTDETAWDLPEELSRPRPLKKSLKRPGLEPSPPGEGDYVKKKTPRWKPDLASIKAEQAKRQQEVPVFKKNMNIPKEARAKLVPRTGVPIKPEQQEGEEMKFKNMCAAFLASPSDCKLFTWEAVDITDDDVYALFEAGHGHPLDVIVALRALNDSGHRYRSVFELVDYFRHCMDSKKCRVAAQRDRKQVKDFLNSTDCNLMSEQMYAQGCSLPFLTVVVAAGNGVQRALHHLHVLNRDGRKFTEFHHLAFAVFASEQNRASSEQVRRDMLKYLKSHWCGLFDSNIKSSLSSGVIETIFNHGEARKDNLLHLKTFDNNKKTFEDVEQLIGEIRTQHKELIRRRDRLYAIEMGPINQDQRDQLLRILNSRFCTLFQVPDETALGATGATGATGGDGDGDDDDVWTPCPFSEGDVDTLDRLISTAGNMANARFYVFEFEREGRCFSSAEALIEAVAIASQSTSEKLFKYLKNQSLNWELKITYSAQVECLLQESNTGPFCMHHVWNFEKELPRFEMLRDLTYAVQTLHFDYVNSKIDERLQTIMYLSSPQSLLLPDDVVMDDHDIAMLFEIGAADTTLYLENFEHEGTRFDSFHDLAVSMKIAMVHAREHKEAVKSFLQRVNMFDRIFTHVSDEDVDFLYSDSRAGPLTLVHLRTLSRRKKRFHNIPALCNAVKKVHIKAVDNKRSDRRLLTNYFADPACPIIDPTYKVSSEDIDALCKICGNGQEALMHLKHLAKDGKKHTNAGSLQVVLTKEYKSFAKLRKQIENYLQGQFRTDTHLTIKDIDALIVGSGAGRSTLFLLQCLNGECNDLALLHAAKEEMNTVDLTHIKTLADFIRVLKAMHVVWEFTQDLLLGFFRSDQCSLFVKPEATNKLFSIVHVDRIMIETMSGTETSKLLTELSEAAVQSPKAASPRKTNSTKFKTFELCLKAVASKMRQYYNARKDAEDVVRRLLKDPNCPFFSANLEESAALRKQSVERLNLHRYFLIAEDSTVAILREMVHRARTKNAPYMKSVDQLVATIKQCVANDLKSIATIQMYLRGPGSLMFPKFFEDRDAFEGWEPVMAPDGVDTFFFNSDTGEVTFNRPQPQDGDEVVEETGLPAGWTAQTDSSDSREDKEFGPYDYFFNPATNQVTWERPIELDLDGESFWVELTDPSTGALYYFNSETNETTWDCPAELAKDASTWTTLTADLPCGVCFVHRENKQATWVAPDSFKHAMSERIPQEAVHGLYSLSRRSTMKLLERMFTAGETFVDIIELRAHLVETLEKRSADKKMQQEVRAYLEQSNFIANTSILSKEGVTALCVGRDLKQLIFLLHGFRDGEVFESMDVLVQETEIAEINRDKMIKHLLDFFEGPGKQMFAPKPKSAKKTNRGGRHEGDEGDEGEDSAEEGDKLEGLEEEPPVQFKITEEHIWDLLLRGQAGFNTLAFVQACLHHQQHFDTFEDMFICIRELADALLAGSVDEDDAMILTTPLDIQRHEVFAFLQGRTVEGRQEKTVPFFADASMVESLTFPDVCSLYEQLGWNTLFILREFNGLGKKFSDLSELYKAVEEKEAGIHALRTEMLEFIQSPSCYLFATKSNKISAETFSDEDAQKLMTDSGAGSSTLLHLWTLEAAHQKFPSFPAVVKAVKEAHLFAIKRDKNLLKNMLKFLTSPSCKLFFNPVQLTTEQLNSLADAGSSPPGVLFHLKDLNEQGKRFESIAEVMVEVTKLNERTIEEKKRIYKFLTHRSTEAECSILTSSYTFLVKEILPIFRDTGAGVSTMNYLLDLNQNRANKEKFRACSELVTAVKLKHSQRMDMKRGILSIIQNGGNLLGYAPRSYVDRLHFDDLDSLVELNGGKEQIDVREVLTTLNKLGRKYRKMDELLVAVQDLVALNKQQQEQVLLVLNANHCPFFRGIDRFRNKTFKNSEAKQLLHACHNSPETLNVLKQFFQETRRFKDVKNFIATVAEAVHAIIASRQTVLSLQNGYPTFSLTNVIPYSDRRSQMQDIAVFLSTQCSYLASGTEDAELIKSDDGIFKLYYDTGAEGLCIRFLTDFCEKSTFAVGTLEELENAVNTALDERNEIGKTIAQEWAQEIAEATRKKQDGGDVYEGNDDIDEDEEDTAAKLDIMKFLFSKDSVLSCDISTDDAAYLVEESEITVAELIDYLYSLRRVGHVFSDIEELVETLRNHGELAEYFVFQKPVKLVSKVTEDDKNILVSFLLGNEDEAPLFHEDDHPTFTQELISNMIVENRTLPCCLTHLRYLKETQTAKFSDPEELLHAMYELSQSSKAIKQEALLLTQDDKFALCSFHFDPYDIDRVYEESAAGNDLVNYLHALNFTAERYHDINSLEELIITVRTAVLTANFHDSTNEDDDEDEEEHLLTDLVVAYLTGEECKLFEGAGQVPISKPDLQTLVRCGGGDVNTAAHLKRLNDNARKFDGFVSLIQAVRIERKLDCLNSPNVKRVKKMVPKTPARIPRKKTKTKKVMRDKPTPWVREIDDESGDPYWVNEETDETTWDKPEGFGEQEEVEVEYEGDSDEDEEEGNSLATSKKGPWTKVLDEESGDYYYHNEETDETAWSEPEDFNVQEDQQKDFGDTGDTNEAEEENIDVTQESTITNGTQNKKQAQKTGKGATKKDTKGSKTASTGGKGSAEASKAPAKNAAKGKGKSNKKKEVDNYPWVKVLDDESGDYYYHNEETDETDWDRPAGWKD